MARILWSSENRSRHTGCPVKNDDFGGSLPAGKLFCVTENISQTDERPEQRFRTLEQMEQDLDRCIGALRPTLGGERYLTDRELSERLKISRRTLQEYRSSGEIPYYCVCGKVLYRESDIERVLEEHCFALP